MNKRIAWFATFCLVAFAVGCKDQSRPADLPPLTACVVSVVQDGQPLEGAIVNLVGIDANTKYQATGVTDAAGKATLATYGYDGVPQGRYKVCIWKDITEGSEQQENADGETTFTEGIEYRTVDMQYFSDQSTPLEIEITDKELPETTFDVGESIKQLKK